MPALLKNDRYLRALLCQDVDYTPIWMMRQAGRYLPEYRELRAAAGSFMALCTNPEFACEVTLQPLKRFDLDAAIIFSDILTIPDAMGMGLYFEAGEGPRFKKTIQQLADIKNLPIPDPNIELSYVMDAISLTRKSLIGEVPLIGFSGSPWTLATYMIEGGSSKSFSKIKKMMYAEPAALHLLLDKLADSVILYLNAQIQAGAQSVMIFDSWGGALSHEGYLEFSLNYMQKIVAGINRGQRPTSGTHGYVPVTLFTKGGGLWLDNIINTGCDAIGVDWAVDLHHARELAKRHSVAVQGNMDPSVLYGSQQTIETHVAKVLAEFGSGNGHVFNFGHGIHQDTPIDNVSYFVNLVHSYSKRYHQ